MNPQAHASRRSAARPVARRCGALLPLVIAMYGCAAEPAHAASTARGRPVQVVLAERALRPVVAEVVGTVRAVRSSTLASMIGGTVAEIRVGLGSSVRAGEVLVRLSAREVDARVQQARALSALAGPERDRAVKLKSLSAITAAQYDAAIAQWNIAQAKQSEASAVADHTVLRAPFSGVVTAKLANAGDTAMPGQALLVVEAPSAFRFEAQVPESLAAGPLENGTAVSVRLDGLDHDITGTVAEVQPASDEATRTRLVKVELPITDGLRSGRFGRLMLAVGESWAISVPAAALVRHGQLEGVFVVDAGLARLRLVRSGRERDGRLEIASGLSGDETVVLAAADIRDGQRVEVAP